MKKFLNTLKYIIALSTGVFLLYIVYRGISFKTLWEGLKHANYFWIIAALLISLLGHLSRGMRWNLLLRPMDYNVKPARSFMAVMIGYAANFGLPRMGEITRCIILNRSDRIPLNKLIGTVIVERAFDFLTLVFLVFLTLLVEFKPIKDFIYHAANLQSSKWGQIINTTNILLAFALLILAAASLFFLKKSNGKFKQSKWYIKIRGVVSGFYDGIISIKTMKEKWQFLGHTTFIWFTYFLMTYFIFFALEPTSHLGLIPGLTTLTIGSLGFIMPVQGGVGTYHFAAKQSLKIYGIGDQDASLYALLAHTSQTLFILLVAAVCFLIFLYNQRKMQYETI